jgi:hypothetical protein
MFTAPERSGVKNLTCVSVVVQMLIPPNRTRSLSSPTCPSCMTCSPSLRPATPSSMPRHSDDSNSLKSLPAPSTTGSGSTPLLCRSVLRIRNFFFGSGFESGSGLKLVSVPDPVSDPDSNPDSNPGFESGSESWIRI